MCVCYCNTCLKEREREREIKSSKYIGNKQQKRDKQKQTRASWVTNPGHMSKSLDVSTSAISFAALNLISSVASLTSVEAKVTFPSSNWT